MLKSKHEIFDAETGLFWWARKGRKAQIPKYARVSVASNSRRFVLDQT